MPDQETEAQVQRISGEKNRSPKVGRMEVMVVEEDISFWLGMHKCGLCFI